MGMGGGWSNPQGMGGMSQMGGKMSVFLICVFLFFVFFSQRKCKSFSMIFR